MDRSTSRLASLRRRMKSAGADLVALGPGAHLQWLLGFVPHADERPCLLVVGPEKEAFLMPALNAEGAKRNSKIGMHIWDDADGPRAALVSALKSTKTENAVNVVLDETMRADFALLLLDNLPGANPGFCESTVGALRLCKDQSDLDSLKENAQIADRVMTIALEAIAPGKTEKEVAQLVRNTFLEMGADPQFAIVGTGGNGAMPHHATGDTEINFGDAVVLDIGGRKGEYSSDITRMAVVGEAPPGYDEIHSIVEHAFRAAFDTVRPGVRACDVDNAARTAIKDAGYGEHFVHRTGHGLGIEVHEPPYIMSSSNQILEQGMVFSIEPGIYLSGRFGVRLEDIVIVREHGAEILSSLSRERYTAQK
ncbi:MAG: aminopeptidase P family protein [Albidovulum sp.]|nr:aminopeptidase P family protein [Albidovulum sp.]MDE0530941.1 aminopeptidase P family protein [Albidovulum sp.]